MNKKLVIITIPAVLIFIIILLIYLIIKQWDKEKEEIISRCYTYDKKANKFGTDIVDCYGYITIHYVDGYYSITDLRYSPGSSLAEITSLKQFRVINNKLYAIDKKTWASII